ELGPHVRRLLAHLEEVREPDDVRERQVVPQAEPPGEPSRRADVRLRELLTHGDRVPPARGHRGAGHGHLDAPALRAGAYAVADLPLPRGILARRGDLHVEEALVDAADLDRHARRDRTRARGP